MINTKDQTRYFRAFSSMVRYVYTVPVTSSEFGVPNVELADRAREAGLPVEPSSSIADALTLLRDKCDPLERPPRILIGGSLYLVGMLLAENGTPPM
jgi:dihydrofolate synthase/folylpolyglutamate synthase